MIMEVNTGGGRGGGVASGGGIPEAWKITLHGWKEANSHAAEWSSILPESFLRWQKSSSVAGWNPAALVGKVTV